MRFTQVLLDGSFSWLLYFAIVDYEAVSRLKICVLIVCYVCQAVLEFVLGDLWARRTLYNFTLAIYVIL